MERSSRRLGVFAAATATVAAATLVTATPASQAPRGGTYRVGWESTIFSDGFPWTHDFDPTGELDHGAKGIYSNLLLRTLVGTNHVAGSAGQVLVPDLARSLPAPTDGGRTYTYRLRGGVRFGPPLDREVTAGDIRYAIERLARPGNGSEIPEYFGVIRGFDAYRRGRAPRIAGISTPNAHTISFHLTRPAPDFPLRLTLPSTAPLPRELGRCFEGRRGAYGRDVVSTGPYMIDGAASVRADSCRSLTPMRGITDTQLVLVRNPHYDPQTDSVAARESNPDRFVFLIAGGGVEVAKKLEAGQLDDAYFYATAKLLAPYAERARRQGRLRTTPTGTIVKVTMNLTQPPFDDVHVRRALNWLVDKEKLLSAWGGPMAGPIARHVLPASMLGADGRTSDPYRTRGDHGDLARAKAEMARSKYATRSGVCIARACKRVRAGQRFGSSPTNYAGSQRLAPMVREQAKKIGITFINRSIRPDKPSSNMPIIFTDEWLEDVPDPTNYVDLRLSSTAIKPEWNLNLSLVGITPRRAARLGVKGNTRNVPSIDADLARCNSLSGEPRLGCYRALDLKVMNDVVPWVPLLWRNRITILGPQVTKWAFDEASSMTAYAHVAVRR